MIVPQKKMQKDSKTVQKTLYLVKRLVDESLSYTKLVAMSPFRLLSLSLGYCPEIFWITSLQLQHFLLFKHLIFSLILSCNFYLITNNKIDVSYLHRRQCQET